MYAITAGRKSFIWFIISQRIRVGTAVRNWKDDCWRSRHSASIPAIICWTCCFLTSWPTTIFWHAANGNPHLASYTSDEISYRNYYTSCGSNRSWSGWNYGAAASKLISIWFIKVGQQ